MMRESYERDRWIDKVSIARELRGFVQGAWVALATGEVVDVTYGWQADTCVDRYDELDAVGRVGVRTAPLFVGLAIAALVAQAPLRAPTGLVWLPTIYLGALWVAFTFYDAVAGVWRGIFRGRTPGVEAPT